MRKIPYFDGHCDTIYRCFETGEPMCCNGGHIALDRLDGFSAYAQIFTMFWSAAEAPQAGMFSVLNRQHDLFLREMEANSGKISHCRTAAEIRTAWDTGKAAAVLSMEGGDLIECDPERLELVWSWGVKLLNPTWNCANALSGTHREDPERGLSDLGRVFAREAQRLGIYLDVSHLSRPGFWDLMDLTEKPIVASHSNSSVVYPHSRGLDDDQFRAIAETGGVVGINLYADFIGQTPKMEDLMRHIEHFLDLGGEKTVALGGDLDGCDETVAEIHGVQDVPKLWQALESRGYPQQLLEDIFFRNWMRLM